MKIEGIYVDMAKDVQTRFDTLNYEKGKLLPKGRKYFGRKIMTEFHTLRPEMCSYLMDDNGENKKPKDTKGCAIKRKIQFKDYKNCLEATQLENKSIQIEKNKIDVDSLIQNNKKFWKSKLINSKNKLILKSQQRFRNKKQIIFTEEVNKMALSILMIKEHNEQLSSNNIINVTI